MRLSLCLLCLCLASCQFAGGTALPPLPGLVVETPSGWKIKTNANTKGSLTVKDGDREITAKLTQDVASVVESQATLAQGLEGLAKEHTKVHQITVSGIIDAFKAGLAAANPLPGPPAEPGP